jgi:DNA-binding MarR family transcriptional regulator
MIDMPNRSTGDEQPAASDESSVQPDNNASGPPLLRLALQAQRMRKTVAALFPRDVFRDFAWDILLELFVAEQRGRAICVKDLILVSGETSTSALRRIDRLEGAGLLQRRHDSPDHRRVSVALTAKGDEAMTALLRSLIIPEKTSA